MKPSLRLVLVSTFFFCLGVTALWLVASHLARKKTVETLTEAPSLFRSINENAVDGALWYACRLALDDVGPTAEAKSVEFMCKLAREHHMDEMNIVSRTGKVLASNHPQLVGINLRGEAEMQPVFDRMGRQVRFHVGRQSFRHGVGGPQTVSRYYTVGFPDGSGFIEVGFTLEHFVRALSTIDDEHFKHWKIGRLGYFESVDRDGDGLTDRSDSPETAPVGDIATIVTADGASAFALEFACFGLLYRAVLPVAEFDDQRTQVVVWGGLVAGFFALLLGFNLKRQLKGTRS